MDEKNAQQFVEQLGPGKRPLWAVPVLLRLRTCSTIFRRNLANFHFTNSRTFNFRVSADTDRRYLTVA